MTVWRVSVLVSVMIGAAPILSPGFAAQNQSATPSQVDQVARPGPALRCNVGVFGEGTSVLVMGGGPAGIGHGLSFELDAQPNDRLVLSTECTIQSGAWTLRIDDGTSEPNYLPLNGFPRVLILGSSHYRVLVYSDDADAKLEFRGLRIEPEQPQDLGLPLAWPTAGPIVAAERARYRLAWLDLLSIPDSVPDLAKSSAIARFIYQRSAIVGIDAKRFVDWGEFGAWRQDGNRTIDGDCGVFASAMSRMCDRVGIVNRLVCLGSAKFYRGESLGDTHTLVEVFDPESKRWILLDPTFNIEFLSEDGTAMGIADLFATQLRKAEWRAVPIGPLRSGRTIEDYYIPLQELLFCADAPAVGSLGQVGAAFQTHPETVSQIVRLRYASKLLEK